MRTTACATLARRERLRRQALITAGGMLLLGIAGAAYTPASAKTLPGETAVNIRQSFAAGADPRFASLHDVDSELRRMRTARRLKRPLPDSLPEPVRRRAYAYRPLVERYAKRYDLPPELIFAIIERESRFDPRARSAANAIGLMQIIPDQAGDAASRFVRARLELPAALDLEDPETNIHLGTAYFRLLLDNHFDDIEDEDVRVAVALAAYNWGPGNMRQALVQGGIPGSVAALESLLQERAPAETRRFVRGVASRLPAYL